MKQADGKKRISHHWFCDTYKVTQKMVFMKDLTVAWAQTKPRSGVLRIKNVNESKSVSNQSFEVSIIFGLTVDFNKPGTAQVGAISKAQISQKDFKVSECSSLQHPELFFEKSLTMPKI